MTVATGMVLTAPRRFEKRQFAIPGVAPDEGVLRVEACGLCGTDHEQYSGDMRSRHAFIPGHEVVGVIDQIGTEASARAGSARLGSIDAAIATVLILWLALPM